MDVLTPEQRQRCMSAIGGKNTKPEMIVRKLLYSLGYRYRIHYPGLPGKPDLAFPGKRKVIFIHGCFWHRHDCKKGRSLPSKNEEFWQRKLSDNAARDQKNINNLQKLGWEVFVVWECEINQLEFLVIELNQFLGT